MARGKGNFANHIAAGLPGKGLRSRCRFGWFFVFRMFGKQTIETLWRVAGVLLGVAAAPLLRAESPLYLPESIFPELEEILRVMEEESPEMLVQRARVQAAEAGEEISLAPKWPQVELNLQLTNRSEFRDSDPTFQNTTQPFGVGRLEQELYHWGALDAFRDIAKFRKAIEENNYRETYRMLALRVRSLYLRLLFARAQIAFYEGEVERFERQLSRNEQQATRGQVTADQLEISRLTVEEAMIELDRVRDEAAMLEEDLRLASGWNGPISGPEVKLMERLRQLENAEAAMAAQMLRSAQAPPSVEFENKQRQLDIEEAEYVRIRSQNLPLFDFVAEAYQDQIATEGRDNIDRTVVTAFLRINWYIFDGFQTKYEKIRSKARQRGLEREAEHIAARDELEVERLKNNRKLLERNLRLWERRVAISENALERVQAERDNNTATETDLLAARNELLADRLSLASYRLDLLENSSELLSIFGRDPFGEPKKPMNRPVGEEYPTNFFW